MLFGNCKAEITVRQVDNGYILQWERERPKRPRYASVVEPDLGGSDERGIEIVADRKALVERLKSLGFA